MDFDGEKDEEDKKKSFEGRENVAEGKEEKSQTKGDDADEGLEEREEIKPSDLKKIKENGENE